MFNKNSSAGTAAKNRSKSSLFARLPLLLAIPMLCAVSGKAQVEKEWKSIGFPTIDTIYRYLKVNNDSFEIRYIHGLSYMEPSVAVYKTNSDGTLSEDTQYYFNHRHYFADINVFKLIQNNWISIGKEMEGYYVPAGCFEDVPENWVTTANKQSVSK